MQQVDEQAHVGRLGYRITEGVLARSAGGTMILFHPETERLLALNECGSRVWQILSEGADLATMLDRLIVEFDAPETVIRQQVLEFLVQLECEQIIHRQETTRDEPYPG